jgi:uncharacterized protein (TIGR01777 family)
LRKIVIAGATGFIGQKVTSRLLASQAAVVVLTRRPDAGRAPLHPLVSYVQWDGKNQGDWTRQVDGADAVINLSGQSIAGKRWSNARKEELLLSRTQPTSALVQAIRASGKRPQVLINASAVGYYGHVAQGTVAEDHPPGSDFLGNLCEAWEAAALSAQDLGVRVVLLRSGIVLDKQGGALQRMLLPFRLFLGGSLGSGDQWFPWIHTEDEVQAILFTLETSGISGPVNLAAPEPATMQEFSRAVGKVLRRPSFFRVPAFVLRAALGEMADIVLTGQKVIPQKLNKAGFEFRFPALVGALEDLLHQLTESAA